MIASYFRCCVATSLRIFSHRTKISTQHRYIPKRSFGAIVHSVVMYLDIYMNTAPLYSQKIVHRVVMYLDKDINTAPLYSQKIVRLRRSVSVRSPTGTRDFGPRPPPFSTVGWVGAFLRARGSAARRSTVVEGRVLFARRGVRCVAVCYLPPRACIYSGACCGTSRPKRPYMSSGWSL